MQSNLGSMLKFGWSNSQQLQQPQVSVIYPNRPGATGVVATPALRFPPLHYLLVQGHPPWQSYVTHADVFFKQNIFFWLYANHDE